MFSISFVVLVAVLAVVSAKLVEVRQNVLVMNEKDRIVGKTEHVFQRDVLKATPPPLPVPPMNTDSSIQSLLRDAFPVGSPNVTVSDPWQKKAETCSWSTDSYLIHHFEDTVFVDTNDLCSLAPGLYTWIATADYQLSFAQFINTYEFSSKHANIALKRTGFVAGEIAVIPGSSRSREQISWNLMSGTYSIPISEDQNPNDPMAYLENVLYPKMKTVFSALPCASKLNYGKENEFFPDVLASGDEVSTMCANNYFVMYENALTWKSNGKSVCSGWDPVNTCAQ